jgi:hypothetical protein
VRIAVVLIALTTLAHADAPRDAIERARELEAQLSYDEALAIIESAIQAGQSDRDRLVELHLIAGRLSAGLDRAKLAEDHFAVVLALDPARTLPDGASPKITVPFTVARTKTTPLDVKLVVTKTEVALQASPLVAGIELRYRDGRAQKFPTTTAARSGDIFEVRALDLYGNVVWTGTPPGEPHVDKPLVVTHDDRSLFQRWTTWAALTGVALAAGGVAAWRYNAAQNEFDDKRGDGMTDFTDLQSIENRGKRWALTANISFGVAAALGITTVTTFFVFRPTATSDGATVGVAGTF